jgi:hypothetical protein
MFWLGGELRAGDTMTRGMGVVAACILILAGCNVKLGGQVVDSFDGERPASPSASDPADAFLPPPPLLSPPPSIPMPSPPPAVENHVRPERLPVASEAATPSPAASGKSGFISADRVNLRSCPGQRAKCSPTATLRFNDEVRVLRLDKDDWALVRVPRLNQNGYVLRTYIAPTRQTRPKGHPPAVSPPDGPQKRSGKDLRGTGEQRTQGGPREELIK